MPDCCGQMDVAMVDGPSADRENTSPGDEYRFGGFHLDGTIPLLLHEGRPVPLGGKALEILVILVANAGAVVPRDTLLEAVWRGSAVSESTLRVHMSMLRRTLGDPGTGGRFIANVAGRGYCFVAPVASVALSPGLPQRALPVLDALSAGPSNAAIFGREDDFDRLVTQVCRRRLTTIIGPGGVGKTTVAGQVAAALQDSFDEIRTIDLAALSDEAAVATAVALAFGLHVFSDDPTDALCRHQRDRRLLVVLDSCEHVIENAAWFAERLVAEGPQFTILATSREALRVSEERVHRLAPLECPIEGEDGTDEILRSPAVRLFLHRASSLNDDFAVDNSNAAIIAHICRALDGLPLAIELAAGQLDFLGVEGVARGLDNLFSLLARGPRNAAPRQQALRATLDWSYRLLSVVERATLRRLAIFQASFSLSSAVAIAAEPDDTDGQRARNAIADLLAKSLLAVDASGQTARYRLLDTTRAYARAMLADVGESEHVARLHADHVAMLLRDRLDLDRRGSGEPLITNGDVIEDLRAALRWSYSPSGSFDTALLLTISAAFVMLEMSLFDEARSWIETGLGELPPERAGTLAELNLRVHLNRTSPLDGTAGDNLAAILAMAETFADRAHMARILDMVFLIRLRVADYRGALGVARQIDRLLPEIPAIGATFCTPWMKGTACHFLGDNEAALSFLSETLASPPAIRTHARFSGNPNLYAQCFQARTLWITGWETQGIAGMATTEALAHEVGHPMLRATALIWLCQLALWSGDDARAERYCDEVDAIAQRFTMGSQRAMAIGLRGWLALRAGATAAGIDMLMDSVAHLRRYQQQMLLPCLTGGIAQGLSALGRQEEALVAAQQAIACATGQNAHVFLPELQLIHGRVLSAARPDRSHDIRSAYEAAIDSAAVQGAAAWEARAVIALGQYCADQIVEPLPETPTLERLFARLGRREILTSKDAAEQQTGRVDRH